MNKLLNLTISEMRRGLDSGDFSSHELVKAALDSAENNKDLNAFITLTDKQALQAADLADKEIKAGQAKNWTGIPVAIKDVILTKGIKTTAASKILNNFIPPYDATVTKKLNAAGAISIGKTNMDEFAMGSSNERSAFGGVKNPWDKERIPGGSSGGSSAAVAARIIPMALGSDTGGSIRQPAAMCGICGMKPTYGRVSRYGVIAYASSLDQIGAFTTNITDLALTIETISGKDQADSTSVNAPSADFKSALNKDIKGIRVGIPKEYFIDGLNPEIKQSVQTAVKKLEDLGAKIVEISLPHTPYAVPCYYIVATAEASSNLSRYDGIRYGHRTKEYKDLMDLYCRSRSEGFGDEVKRRILIGTFVLSSGYYDAYYLRAQKVRKLIQNDFTKAFANDCDVIASPVAPNTAFKFGEKTDDPVAMYLEDIFTIPVNLAGLPALSLPCGFDSKNLPIGLQLIGKPWDEAGILQVAHAYEQSTEWHKKTPI